jgi:hypothetical protein
MVREGYKRALCSPAERGQNKVSRVWLMIRHFRWAKATTAAATSKSAQDWMPTPRKVNTGSCRDQGTSAGRAVRLKFGDALVLAAGGLLPLEAIDDEAAREDKVVVARSPG